MDKKQIFICALLGLVLLNGCATQSKLKAGADKNNIPLDYRIDLDGDGLKEFIKIEDGLSADSKGAVVVLAADKSKIGDFAFSGKFTRVEFVDLDSDGNQQLALWALEGTHYNSLIIYGLKNNRVYKIFDKSSPCPIEIETHSAIPKVKVGIPRLQEKGWTYEDEPDWQVWVWSGERFIPDHFFQTESKQ